DVALSRAGDLAVIGVPYDDVGGFRVGAAYVYVRTEGGPSGGWELEAALVPSEADVESYLGQRVAIGGEPGAEVVALGGYLEGDDPDDRRSAAHVFRRDPSTGAWADEGPLWAEGATEDDLFGGSIAAVGDLVLVGAARSDWECSASQGPCTYGAAYLFRRTEGAGGAAVWEEETRFLSIFDYSVSPPVEGAGFFGEGVALSAAEGLDGVEALAAVGSSGLVLTFERRGGAWVATDTLRTDTGSNSDLNFGLALDSSGTRLVVGGAGWDGPDTFETNVGRVQVFEREPDGRWRFAGARYASDGEAGDGLGTDVALSGEVIAAGAPYDDNEGGNGAGAAYVVGAPGGSAEPGAEAGRGAAVSVWPSPARHAAAVALVLPVSSEVRLALFDVLGRRLVVLHGGPRGAGKHRLRFDAAWLPAGVYLVEATTG